jgi:hypothetical protein
MPEQQTVQARIVHYNTQASLLYEQAFFLELLIATLASRRYDEFNADVALAHSRIMAQVISSIEQRELLLTTTSHRMKYFLFQTYIMYACILSIKIHFTSYVMNCSG